MEESLVGERIFVVLASPFLFLAFLCALIAFFVVVELVATCSRRFCPSLAYNMTTGRMRLWYHMSNGYCRDYLINDCIRTGDLYALRRALGKNVHQHVGCMRYHCYTGDKPCPPLLRALDELLKEDYSRKGDNDCCVFQGNEEKHERIVHWLVDRGADPNMFWVWLLSEYGPRIPEMMVKKTMKYMLAHGMDPNWPLEKSGINMRELSWVIRETPNSSNITPLFYIVTNPWSPNRPSKCAWVYGGGEWVDAVEILLHHGADTRIPVLAICKCHAENPPRNWTVLEWLEHHREHNDWFRMRPVPR